LPHSTDQDGFVANPPRVHGEIEWGAAKVLGIIEYIPQDLADTDDLHVRLTISLRTARF
jgi:hypothetical protein